MKRVALVLTLALLAAAAPLEAELSWQGNGKIYFQPSKTGAWGLVRHGVDPRWILNPDGDLRGDGLPSFGINPVTGQPEAVWARFAGDYEVVFSLFDGTSWTQPVQVSGGYVGNDILPALAHDSRGDRIVTWFRAESSGQIYMTASPAAEAAFLPPVRLSKEGLPARSASIVVDGLLAYVALEEERGQDRFVLVVAAELSRVSPAGPVKGGGAGINPFVVDETQVEDPGEALPPTERGLPSGKPWWQLGVAPPQQDPLDPLAPSRPMLHMANGRIWVDWIAGTYLGFAEVLGYAFGDIGYVEIKGGSVEAARRSAEREVIGR